MGRGGGIVPIKVKRMKHMENRVVSGGRIEPKKVKRMKSMENQAFCNM